MSRYISILCTVIIINLLTLFAYGENNNSFFDENNTEIYEIMFADLPQEPQLTPQPPEPIYTPISEPTFIPTPTATPTPTFIPTPIPRPTPTLTQMPIPVMPILCSPIPKPTPMPIIANKIIRFKDDSLKEALISKGIDLDRDGEISFSEAVRVEELYLNSCGISILEGIEYFENIKHLNIKNNTIKDINSLSKLSKLKTLYLSNNDICDFSPVESYYYNLTHKDFRIDYKPGDIFYDEEITSNDYVLLKRYILGIENTFPYAKGYELLVADLNGDGKINSIDLVLLKRYILGLIDIFPVQKPSGLLVSNVVVDNLKEVFVEFNKYIDEGTVSEDSIKINGNEGEVKLKKDKKTVVITLKDGQELENYKDYTLIIAGIGDVKGGEIEKFEKTFTAFDQFNPEVKSINITGYNSLEIILSEPVIKTERFELNIKYEYTTYGNTYRIEENGKKIVVELWHPMVRERNYELRISNLEDYAGNVSIQKSYNFEYIHDSTPILANVEDINENYVKIVFNKPVSGLESASFYHTFSTWTAIGVYTDENMDNAVDPYEYVDVVWVKFADNNQNGIKMSEGWNIIGIIGGSGYNRIKDKWYNNFESTIINVSLTKDNGCPRVTIIEAIDEQTVNILFNRSVNFSEKNVDILNFDAEIIDAGTISVTPIGEPMREYVISLGKNFSGQTIGVRVKDVENNEFSQSKIDTYIGIVQIPDFTPPKIIESKINESERAIYLTFNEYVDDSASNIKNYSLVDAFNNYIPLSQTPVCIYCISEVRIYLTYDEWIKLIDYNLYIQGIKDIYGNVMEDYTVIIGNILDYPIELEKPLIEKVEVINQDEMIITFNQLLSRVDKGSFTLNGQKPEAISIWTNDKGVTVVTLTAANNVKFKPDLSGGVTLSVDTSGIYKIHNKFNVPIKNYVGDDILTTSTNPAIKDRISPEITKDENGNYNIFAKAGTSYVEIVFNEPIDKLGLANVTFSIKDRIVEIIEIDKNHSTNYKVLVFLRGNSFIEGEKISLTQHLFVEDLSGNRYQLPQTVVVTVD
ncbi:UNVERIFIED_CONTAM: dockerin type I repeat protein [Acetivibrio alkalicellulosi]